MKKQVQSVKAFGIRQKKYHVECQSTTDSTLIIRLFEYDTQMAIEDGS